LRLRESSFSLRADLSELGMGQDWKSWPICSAQWKGINRKQSTRWQHLSRLKASAFFSLQKKFSYMKHSNSYLGLVLPSGGWQSLIERSREIYFFFSIQISHRSSLNFSVQVENGWDYQNRMTLNKAQWLCLVGVSFKQQNLV
jgi:hypothetical protein